MTLYREYTCRHCSATATEVVRQTPLTALASEPEPRECHACGCPMSVAVKIDGVIR